MTNADFTNAIALLERFDREWHAGRAPSCLKETVEMLKGSQKAQREESKLHAKDCTGGCASAECAVCHEPMNRCKLSGSLACYYCN